MRYAIWILCMLLSAAAFVLMIATGNGSSAVAYFLLVPLIGFFFKPNRGTRP